MSSFHIALVGQVGSSAAFVRGGELTLQPARYAQLSAHLAICNAQMADRLPLHECAGVTDDFCRECVASRSSGMLGASR